MLPLSDSVSAPELLQDVLSLSPTPLALLRPAEVPLGKPSDFFLEYLNPAGQRELALPERPARLLSTCFATAEETGLLRFLHQVAETGAAGHHEADYFHPAGTLRYHLQARRSGPLLLLALTQLSQPDSAVVEQALRESQSREQKALAEAEAQRQQLHTLVMQAPACIASLEGPELVFTLVNPQYQALVGERTLLGLPLRKAWPELEGQPYFALLEGVYRTGESVYGREQVAYLDISNSGRLDPLYFNFIYQAIRSAEGEITGVTIFAFDVSEQVTSRQQVQYLNEELAVTNEELQVANEEFLTNNAALQLAQQQLQQLNEELEVRVQRRTAELRAAQAATERQKDRLERLFMQAPAAICILKGPELVFELVNPAYQKLFRGRTLQGRPVLDALPEIADHAVYQFLRQVYETGRAHENLSMLIPLVDIEAGVLENRYFDYVQQPHFDESGQIDGVVVFAFEVTAQVEAHQASEAAARQLRLVTDSLPVLISYVDQERKYRFVNRAYKTWFGREPETLLGQPIWTIIGPAAYQSAKEYIDQALTGQRVDFEIRMPYRDNLVKHIRTSYVPNIVEGEVVGFYSVVLDITEQVEARQEANRQQALLQDLFMEAPTPVAILNGPTLVYQLVNPAYQRIFPGRKLLGLTVLEALPELEGTLVPEVLGRVYRTGETFVAQEMELQVARHEGGPLDDLYWTFTYQARRDLAGTIDGVMVFAHEVTDQVRARQMVEKSEQYVRRLADNVPVIIWVTDAVGKCTYLNQRWYEYTNQTPAEALGFGWLEAIHPEDQEATRAIFLEALTRQEPFSILYRQLHHNGQYRWALDSGLPRFNVKKEMEGFIGTVVDIHEQKQAEQALQQLAEKLRATNQQLVSTNVDLDNFIYTASHDLKAPITNIEGLLYALQSQLPPEAVLTEQLHPLLGMMHESVQRFQRTLNYLSDVTKLQKEYDQPITQVELGPIIEDVRQDLQPLIQETGARLELDLGECNSVSFSAKNLRSVVYNLFSNAIKYHRPDQPPLVRIRCHQQGEYIVLSIQDNGLGLTPAQQPQLFTMFRRFHNHVEGSGIGLYMVKRSVENAGGHIEVQSTLNEGSIFSVYFRQSTP
ncbi:PAS domain S-box protein [Hymenobacter sediminis]|uniref:PAS domain-containing protein n=1 Tax=Hymenobacter sediminis TaxID=2218621 RepID=UPI000DA6D661|nr:PAS domain-containing protein [Hymenobacter sediminis]RPD49844.1 PAS domain S-box protein [Hymenobacter sediminis]